MGCAFLLGGKDGAVCSLNKFKSTFKNQCCRKEPRSISRGLPRVSARSGPTTVSSQFFHLFLVAPSLFPVQLIKTLMRTKCIHLHYQNYHLSFSTQSHRTSGFCICINCLQLIFFFNQRRRRRNHGQRPEEVSLFEADFFFRKRHEEGTLGRSR